MNTYDGGARQVWRIINQTLYNPATNECLDDTAFGGQGTFLETWSCNGGSNQNWDVIGYASN
ncbi:RICIN domain-containing protein [Kitasatospora sp. NBC_01250]|uniref:RICIN domain-containing protein n=1 Tax=Kitasatospora sp. NBC_01250 TaxID=2903571 RepID=UPI002E38073A|nr:RICIN domain-containing protein [Kitasatospora sp. NBC_01250]